MNTALPEKCPKCKNSGFTWGRTYCQYCGFSYTAARHGQQPLNDKLHSQNMRSLERHMEQTKSRDIILTFIVTIVLLLGAVFYFTLEVTEDLVLSNLTGEGGLFEIAIEITLYLVIVLVAAGSPIGIYRSIRARRAKRFWQG